MQFNLLLTNIIIFCASSFYFELFLKVFLQFRQTAKINNVIPTAVPITVANDAIEKLALVADKTIKDLSK